MSMIYAFYNPLAGNGSCKTDVHFLDLLYDEPIVYCDLTKSETYEEHLFSLTSDDKLILCGGDGTLNRFFNLLSPDNIPCDILCFPLGTRNVFSELCGHPFGSAPFSIRQRLTRLPRLNINGKVLHFLGEIRWFSPLRSSITLTVDGKAYPLPKLRLLNIRPNAAGDRLCVCIGKRKRRREQASIFGREISICFPHPITPRIDGDSLYSTAVFSATI